MGTEVGSKIFRSKLVWVKTSCHSHNRAAVRSKEKLIIDRCRHVGPSWGWNAGVIGSYFIPPLDLRM